MEGLTEALHFDGRLALDLDCERCEMKHERSQLLRLKRMRVAEVCGSFGFG
jgi:ribosomal protein L44E